MANGSGESGYSKVSYTVWTSGLSFASSHSGTESTEPQVCLRRCCQNHPLVEAPSASGLKSFFSGLKTLFSPLSGYRHRMPSRESEFSSTFGWCRATNAASWLVSGPALDHLASPPTDSCHISTPLSPSHHNLYHSCIKATVCQSAASNCLNARHPPATSIIQTIINERTRTPSLSTLRIL